MTIPQELHGFLYFHVEDMGKHTHTHTLYVAQFYRPNLELLCLCPVLIAHMEFNLVQTHTKVKGKIFC